MWTRMGVLSICALLAVQAGAQEWILVEARDVPTGCQDPLACIPDSRLVLRNMIYMQREERSALAQFLNRVATIRGIPEGPVAGTGGALHDTPMAEKLMPLVDHPGVFFDPAPLDTDPMTAGFSDYIHSRLSQAGVRFLTEEEREATPGRPTLSVRLSPRSESEGCIMPFSVSLSISEEVVMVRNPAIKMSGSAFSAMAKENLANRNYTPLSGLEEVVGTFLEAWQAANPR